MPLSDYEQKRSLLIGAGDAPRSSQTYHPAGGRRSSPPARSCRSATTCRPDAELQGQGRQVEPAAGHRHAARRRTASSTCCPACTRSPGQDYSLAVRTDILEKLASAEPRDLGRPVHGAQGDEGRRTRTSTRSPTAGPTTNTARPAPLLNILAPTFGTRAGWNYQHTTWDPTRTRRSSSTPAAETSTSRCSSTSTRWSRRGCSTRRASPRPTTPRRQKFANGKSFVISGNAQEVNEYASRRTWRRPPTRQVRQDPAADRARGRTTRLRQPAWRTAS